LNFFFTLINFFNKTVKNKKSKTMADISPEYLNELRDAFQKNNF